MLLLLRVVSGPLRRFIVVGFGDGGFDLMEVYGCQWLLGVAIRQN